MRHTYALLPLLLCLAAAPTTGPNSEVAYPALQRKLAELKSQNAELQARIGQLEQEKKSLAEENLSLSRRINDLTPRGKTAVQFPSDGAAHPELIEVGMSKDDAIRMGGGDQLVKIVGKSTKGTVYEVSVFKNLRGDKATSYFLVGKDDKVLSVTIDR